MNADIMTRGLKFVVLGVTLTLAGCGEPDTYYRPSDNTAASPGTLLAGAKPDTSPTVAKPTMSSDEARQFLRAHMLPGGEGIFEIEGPRASGAPRVTAANFSLTHIAFTTEQDQSIVLSLPDFDLNCSGRDKGIYVRGYVKCGAYTFNWNSSEDGLVRRIPAAFEVLKEEAVGFFSADNDARFNAVLQQYPAAQPKPALSEDATRLKVQAEGAVRDADFLDAARLYMQALDIAPWWPAGHFNLALILGETGDYELAIREMKRYIMLAPDAPDARAAQNKIYEWERKTDKATMTMPPSHPAASGMGNMFSPAK